MDAGMSRMRHRTPNNLFLIADIAVNITEKQRKRNDQ